MDPTFDFVMGYIVGALGEDNIKDLMNKGHDAIHIVPRGSTYNGNTLSKGLNIHEGRLLFAVDLTEPRWAGLDGISKINCLSQRAQLHISQMEIAHLSGFHSCLVIDGPSSRLVVQGHSCPRKKDAKLSAANIALRDFRCRQLLGLNEPPEVTSIALSLLLVPTRYVRPPLAISTSSGQLTHSPLPLTPASPADPNH